MHNDKKISINLESLLDLSARLNETIDENYILNITLLTLMGKLRILRACVLFPDDNNEHYIIKYSKGKTIDTVLPFFCVDNFRKLIADNLPENKLNNLGYEYCLPVNYRNQNLLIICLGKNSNNEILSDDEIRYSTLVSNITANALQQARTNTSLINAKNNLERQNQVLNSLFEMTKDFSAILSKQQIIKMLSYRLMGQLMVSRFAVYLIDEKGEFDTIINRFNNDANVSILKNYLEFKKTIHINNLDKETKLKEFLNELSAQILSPMIVQGKTKGFLAVAEKMNEEDWTLDNILFIEALGNTTILALENERLFHQEVEKKLLENEMNLAYEIQINLLPKTKPDIPGFLLDGLSKPSRQVGGDYYDFIELSKNQYLIAIADVSGKGMPASLLMANVQAALRALAPLNIPLIEILHRINILIYNNTSPDKFVTFFAGILNSETKKFYYINAGHNPPIYLNKNKKIMHLTEGGIILGIMNYPVNYKSGEITLSSGDSILFYTDGVTESKNLDNDEFGEEKLQKMFIDISDDEPANILKRIRKEIKDFSNNLPQYDDITMVILKTL